VAGRAPLDLGLFLFLFFYLFFAGFLERLLMDVATGTLIPLHAWTDGDVAAVVCWLWLLRWLRRIYLNWNIR